MSAPNQPSANSKGTPPPILAPGELARRLEEAQQELDTLRRQVEHADRLAALGTLAATIAHEFNNLLTPSMSYAQLALGGIERGQPDLELTRKALTKAQAAGRKAGRICDAILNFARPAPGAGHAAEAADLAAVVEEALATLGHDPAKQGITIRCELARGLRVAIDPLHLEHVLMNLLINARHAMLGRRHGTLSLIAAPHAAAAGPAVRIEVSDTGHGIDPAHLGSIFDPFFTSRDPGSESRGTGLGLSLCRQIVERSGGQITVQSTPGEGTTFKIVLPAAKPDPASRAAA